MTIKEYRSPINGLIQVVMAFNQPRLVVGGMVQSGGVVKKIWEKAIAALIEVNHKVNESLIIGLGCGDCAFEIQKYYPNAQMVGVEIDDKVIEAARCYFDLATVKNLKINIGEGVEYVTKLAKRNLKKRFDLIIIDAYLGKEMPKNLRTKKFFNNLTKILAHDGVVIFNHLFFKEHKQKAEVFIKEMEKAFGRISLVRTPSNLLIFGWF